VEMGKQYTYFLKPAEGWKLHSVTFNDTELTVENGIVITPAVSAAHNKLIVTFEKLTQTEIAAAMQTTQPKVLGTANGLHVANATAGDIVSVYTVEGRLVTKQTLRGSQADVTLAGGQLYIVKVGEKVVKVRL